MNNRTSSNHTNRENDNDFKPFNSIDMESFIGKLKEEDKSYLLIVQTFKWVYLFLTGLYFLIYFAFPFRDSTSLQKLSDLLFILAFAFLFIIFSRYYRMFRKLDYSVSLSEMLSKVIKRYRLSIATFIEASVPLLLIDLSITLNIYHDLTWMSPVSRVLVVQAFLIPLFVGAGYIGYLVWKKKQKPLVDNAKEMLKDLNAL